MKDKNANPLSEKGFWSSSLQKMADTAAQKVNRYLDLYSMHNRANFSRCAKCSPQKCLAYICLVVASCIHLSCPLFVLFDAYICLAYICPVLASCIHWSCLIKAAVSDIFWRDALNTFTPQPHPHPPLFCAGGPVHRKVLERFRENTAQEEVSMHS